MSDPIPSHDFPLDVTYRMKREDFWIWTGGLIGFGALGYYFALSGSFGALFMVILGYLLMALPLIFIPAFVYESYFSKGYLLLTETDITLPKGLFRKGHHLQYSAITGITFKQEDAESDKERYLVLHRGQKEPVELDRQYFKHEHAYQLVVQVLHDQLGIVLVREKFPE